MSQDARPVSREVTTELLARYDRPAPRYTSYPTALEFAEDVGPEEYAKRLADANLRADEALSLYMHLPFCDHRCLFCGCHVIITPHKDKAAPYLELAKREIDILGKHLPDRRIFSQLHLGGGTPTYFKPEQLADLLDHLLAQFHPVEGAELAIEVDPRVTSPEHLDMLAERGFNRVSMGVQDFTPEVQEGIERIQPRDMTEGLIQHARSLGFGGINVDLIYGLPYQTEKTFEASIDAVIEMQPDRAAVYSFAFVPWMRAHMKKLLIDALPPREVKFALFGVARERFLAAGYETIGMDHFAKPEDELAVAKREGRLRRNFQGYTVLPAEEVLGIGISAIGDIAGGHFQNRKKLSDYRIAVEKGELPVDRGVLRDEDDNLRRSVIHGLMCNFVIDIPAIEKRYDVNFAEYFAEDLADLAPHAKEGLVTIEDDAIRATPTGELFVRNLAMCFDRYWRETHRDADKPRFSQSV